MASFYVVSRRVRTVVMLGSLLSVASFAQTAGQIVGWTVSVAPKTAVPQGDKATLELSAEVQEGWHVYALTQVPGGPTPLHVTLDDKGAIRSAGEPSGSNPKKKHDPSFDLDTQFYEQSFVLRVPVLVKEQAVPGKQVIPVSVRLQACSDRTCLPPRTIHLSVPIVITPKT